MVLGNTLKFLTIYNKGRTLILERALVYCFEIL